MTQQKQIYKCNVCGNIVEVLHTGVGELICCGQPMELLNEKKEEEGNEKHLPVVEKTENGILVKVGSVSHPMEQEHYIEWIELVIDGRSCRKFLNPGDKPETEFKTQAQNIRAKAYCNIHGLWSS